MSMNIFEIALATTQGRITNQNWSATDRIKLLNALGFYPLTPGHDGILSFIGRINDEFEATYQRISEIFKDHGLLLNTGAEDTVATAVHKLYFSNRDVERAYSDESFAASLAKVLRVLSSVDLYAMRGLFGAEPGKFRPQNVVVLEQFLKGAESKFVDMEYEEYMLIVTILRLNPFFTRAAAPIDASATTQPAE